MKLTIIKSVQTETEIEVSKYFAITLDQDSPFPLEFYCKQISNEKVIAIEVEQGKVTGFHSIRNIHESFFTNQSNDFEVTELTEAQFNETFDLTIEALRLLKEGGTKNVN
jgi:hypothetical protein